MRQRDRRTGVATVGRLGRRRRPVRRPAVAGVRGPARPDAGRRLPRHEPAGRRVPLLDDRPVDAGARQPLRGCCRSRRRRSPAGRRSFARRRRPDRALPVSGQLRNKR